MTDQKINRKLALAIGWKPKRIKSSGTAVLVRYSDYCWARFDFRHWHIIGPIAQRYDCFPFFHIGKWLTYASSIDLTVQADTPQKAIALAVIAAHEAGLLK